MSTAPRTKLLTADEFDQIPEPEDGTKLELDEGVLVATPPPRSDAELMVNRKHGKLQTRLAIALGMFAESHRLGDVTVETHYRLGRSNRGRDIVRGPDVAFLRQEKIPTAGDEYLPSVRVPPDLAVEVVSPSDRRADVERKVRQYLEAGTACIWVVHPSERSVTVYRGDGGVDHYSDGDVLTSDDAGFDVGGFNLALSELFDNKA